MRRLLVVLLGLLGLLAAAPAPGGDEGEVLALPGARVLASPGLPEAFLPFLPSGAAEPLTLDLPPGPLLVLGLPEEDPVARALAERWQLLPLDGDLAGGYVVAAWHDGRRPLAAVFAADAVALLAARFELESAAPGNGEAPRSLDFHAPPEEGDLRLRRGVRREVPRYRLRALDPRGPLDEAVTTAIAARANRVWIDAGRYGAGEIEAAATRLRRFGVRPLVGPRDRIRAEAEGEGEGLLFHEDWLEPSSRPGAPPVVPGRPRRPDHRPQDWEGIVVAGRAGTGDVLRAAWTLDEAAPEAWQSILLPLLPRDFDSPRDFLVRAAAALARADEETLGTVPWMGPLAAHLAGEAEALPGDALLVPRVPAGARIDGRLDEPAWAWAGGRRYASPPGPVALLAFSDGVRLHLGLRRGSPTTPFHLVVAGHAVAFEEADAVAPGGLTAEVVLDARVLAGDAHPARVLPLRVACGGRHAPDSALVLAP